METMVTSHGYEHLWLDHCTWKHEARPPLRSPVSNMKSQVPTSSRAYSNAPCESWAIAFFMMRKWWTSCILFLKINLFIHLFLAALGLHCCALAFYSCSEWGAALCCSAACGIFPDQGSNPCPLHWQADSQPLRHQGSPKLSILWLYYFIRLFYVCLTFKFVFHKGKMRDFI